MTEHKKRGFRKPLQIALAAAAMVAALCVTAAAANPEAVQELWQKIALSVSIVYEDENTMVIQTDLPEVSVDEVDSRVILSIDGEEVDITDDLRENGRYVHTFSTASITVLPDLTWAIELTMEHGETVTYGPGNQVMYTDGGADADGEAFGFYQFTDDESVIGATYFPPEE